MIDTHAIRRLILDQHNRELDAIALTLGALERAQKGGGMLPEVQPVEQTPEPRTPRKYARRATAHPPMPVQSANASKRGSSKNAFMEALRGLVEPFSTGAAKERFLALHPELAQWADGAAVGCCMTDFRARGWLDAVPGKSGRGGRHMLYRRTKRFPAAGVSATASERETRYAQFRSGVNIPQVDDGPEPKHPLA